MKSVIYSGIMGLVVGDALGVPFEFRQRDTFRCGGMTGYGTYYQPPGTWSDDSSMTLATIHSITTRGFIDLPDIMQHFVRWIAGAEYTPYGSVFDVGGTTRQAIANFYLKGIRLNLCGGRGTNSNGNGSLMRILPFAFVNCTDETIISASSLTHAHPISTSACLIYTSVARNLLQRYPLEAAILGRRLVGMPEFDRLENLDNLHRYEIESTGYVVNTLEAAFWCLLHTDNYRDCVLTAVNLGDDTDTVAAVAGGLAGLFYGVGGNKGIPNEWIEQIARKDWIKALCDEFSETVASNNKF